MQFEFGPSQAEGYHLEASAAPPQSSNSFDDWVGVRVGRRGSLGPNDYWRLTPGSGGAVDRKILSAIAGERSDEIQLKRVREAILTSGEIAQGVVGDNAAR